MSKVIKSIKYTGYAAILKRLLSLALLWFITNNVSKHEVGIFQLFSSVMYLPLLFVFLSFDYLYIVKQNQTAMYRKSMIQTGFWLSVVTSIAFFLGADLLGQMYNNALLANYIKKFFWILPFETLRRSLRFELQKKMKFKTVSKYEVYNSVLYTSLMILAVSTSTNFHTAQMLIITYYLGDFLELGLLYKKTKLKLKHLVNFSSTKKSLKNNSFFSFFTTTNHTAGYFADSIPVLFLGSLFSADALGIYFLANRLISAPVNLLIQAISQVFFASLSSMNDEQISKRIDRYVFIVLAFALPFLGLFIVYSYKLLPLILPETAHQWLDVLPLLAILLIPMASTLIVNPLSPILMIKNKTNYEFYVNIGGLFFRLTAAFIGSFWGFNIAMLCYAIASFIRHIALLVIISKSVNHSLLKTLMQNLFTIVLLIGLGGFFTLSISKNLLNCTIYSMLALLFFVVIVNIFSKNKLINELKKAKG